MSPPDYLKVLLSLCFLYYFARAGVPCKLSGVALGVLEEGPECDGIRRTVEIHSFWDPWIAGGHKPPADGIKGARWALWHNLEQAVQRAERENHAKVHCELTHGVVIIMADWTSTHCNQARHFYEMCVNHDFTPQRCLGKTVAQEPLDPRWITEETKTAARAAEEAASYTWTAGADRGDFCYYDTGTDETKCL